MSALKMFWDWFVEHESEVFDFEADQENIFDRLAVELQRVDPDLTFEFGPTGKQREFVISAGGIKRAFPAVVSLVKAAPTLEKWRITAFRPRRPAPNVVEFSGKRIDPRDVRFSLLDNGTTAGICLFLPEFRESDVDLRQIGYLLLDDLLGEYDVETRLGPIKIFPLKTPTDGERYPLHELPVLFDQLVSQLEGRSAKPT